jgi:hypothetical protein
VSVGDNLLEKPRLEVIALLGALAARTRRVRLHVGCLSTFVIRDPILFAIQCHEDRPDWGTNWESFLDSLPENLFELIDCEGSPV